MNTKHYTTIEQSKKLLEVGMNPETADMIYTMVNGRCTPFIRVETIDELEEDDVLCWSLGALLDIIKPFNYHLTQNTQGNYIISTSFNAWINSELLNALVDMVVWLLENGFIKKNLTK